ncbi:MAG: hypothetical protein ACMXYA_01300 [Candidatus Woesearchaeota archaeon]
MKHNQELEDIIQDAVTVRMNTKACIKSQYISTRICELTTASVEVGFLYGGTMEKKDGKTILDIEDIYLPIEQKITCGTFQFIRGVSKAHTYFKENDKRIIGLGHSHADFDVFHSDTDYDNLRSLVISEGSRFRYSQKKPKEETHYEECDQTESTFETTYYESSSIQESAKIFPSLVYNRVGNFHAGLSYFQEDFGVIEHFDIKKYNVHTALSDEEKKEIDSQLVQILEYNNLPVNQEAIHQKQTVQLDYQI